MTEAKALVERLGLLLAEFELAQGPFVPKHQSVRPAELTYYDLERAYIAETTNALPTLLAAITVLLAEREALREALMPFTRAGGEG